MSTKFTRKLIDIGANLSDPMFRGIYRSAQKHSDDFEHVLKRAELSGVERIIITGGSLEESKEASKIAQTNESFFSTVGCHPTRCNEFDTFKSEGEGPKAYLEELRHLVVNNRSKVVAIGELGLDYDRLQFCSKEIQKLYFEFQLKLAQEFKLPLFLHDRNSTDDFVEILTRNRDKFMPAGGVAHSFTGTANELEKILSLGLYIGINGCGLKTQQNLEVVKLIPRDKLLIETDCPWCEIKRTHASFKHVKTHFKKSKDARDAQLPVTNRNEPSSLIQVLEVLASVREEDIESLAETIHENTTKLFFNK